MALEEILHCWNYYPLKCATLFAYEHINNQSSESAQPYYDEVKSKQNTNVQPGEALTALAIMDVIAEGTSSCGILPSHG